MWKLSRKSGTTAIRGVSSSVSLTLRAACASSLNRGPVPDLAFGSSASVLPAATLITAVVLKALRPVGNFFH